MRIRAPCHRNGPAELDGSGSDEKTGMVLRQNADAPTRPYVRIAEQNSKGEWIGKEEINLAEELAIYIVDTIE